MHPTCGIKRMDVAPETSHCLGSAVHIAIFILTVSSYSRFEQNSVTLCVNVTFLLSFFCADMPGNRIVVFALVAVLLLSSAAGEANEKNALQQLLAQREKARESADRQAPVLRARSAQMERRAHLSEDEREVVTKQIMQAISGMMCV